MELVMHAFHDMAWPMTLVKSLAARIKTISDFKTLTETPQQISWRIHLLKVIPAESIPTVIANVMGAHLPDREIYAQLMNDNMSTLVRMHTQTGCSCPWTPENTDIFKFMPADFPVKDWVQCMYLKNVEVRAII